MDNIGRKIWLAIRLVILLAVIGIIVFFVKKYNNSDTGKTKIYQREINDVLNLQGNKTIIKILKEDVNKDEDTTDGEEENNTN